MEAVKKADNLSTGDTEQRTHNMTIAGTDARQSVNACTTNEVHQQRLDSIVLMVGHADILGSDVLPQLLEIAVAEFTRRHFNAYLMDIGISLCVKMD